VLQPLISGQKLVPKIAAKHGRRDEAGDPIKEAFLPRVEPGAGELFRMRDFAKPENSNVRHEMI
jgi:hypothetical protein